MGWLYWTLQHGFTALKRRNSNILGPKMAQHKEVREDKWRVERKIMKTLDTRLQHDSNELRTSQRETIKHC